TADTASRTVSDPPSADGTATTADKRQAAAWRAQRHPAAGHLRRMLDGGATLARERARARLGPLPLRLDPASSIEQRRARTTELLRELADSGLQRFGFPVEYGGQDDVVASVNVLQIVGHAELSLLVKAGVQWGLFAGTILAL